MGVYLGNTDLVGGGGGSGGGGILGYYEGADFTIAWPEGAQLALVGNLGANCAGNTVSILKDDYTCRRGCYVYARNTPAGLCAYGCGSQYVIFYELPEQPVKGYIDVLVVGGGAGAKSSISGCSTSACYYGRWEGGSSGGVILCQRYPLTRNFYSLCVGLGGCCTGSEYKGYASAFGGLYAYGGNEEAAVSAGQRYSDGATESQTIGTKGLVEACGGGGGAGGAGSNGYISGTTIYGGNGGNRIQSDIEGTMKRYAGGAGNGGYYGCVTSAYTVQRGTDGCGYDYCGGAAPAGSGCRGKTGTVIFRYKIDGSCGVTGVSTTGTDVRCCSCNGYCIYKFGSTCGNSVSFTFN